ncbi:hypothetical protein [Flavobacterium olei]|uniref:hypothetical protein n=1 Tax=Flavobacterium olei TaxID=1886782 RepID=UPI003219FEC7
MNDLTIVFEYYKCIKIDFKNQTIEAYYRDLSCKDTILFTKNDLLKLNQAISQNKIDKQTREFSYPKCNWLMPSFEDKIEVLKDGKIINSIKINYAPNCADDKKPGDVENRIRTFGIEVRNLILKKPFFKRALDSLKVFTSKRKGIV